MEMYLRKKLWNCIWHSKCFIRIENHCLSMLQPFVIETPKIYIRFAMNFSFSLSLSFLLLIFISDTYTGNVIISKNFVNLLLSVYVVRFPHYLSWLLAVRKNVGKEKNIKWKLMNEWFIFPAIWRTKFIRNASWCLMLDDYRIFTNLVHFSELKRLEIIYHLQVFCILSYMFTQSHKHNI